MLTLYNNPRKVHLHQYTGISIHWNVYKCVVLQIIFLYPFHHIVDTTEEAVNYIAL